MPDERCVVQPLDVKRIARSGAGRLDGLDRWIAAVAEDQHGLVARRQMVERGVGRGAIEARIARGLLHPVYRGVYTFGHRLLTREGRWMAAVMTCGPDAVLCRRSAARLWGIVPQYTGFPEVARPSSCRRPGITVLRTRLRPDEIEVQNGIPVTSAARTQFDLAAVLSRREMERVLNEAEVRGLTSRLSLSHLLERYPRRRGNAMLRELLASKEPGGITRNDFEERFVAFLEAHELPRPRFNATIALRGRFFEADCLWQAQRLMVELDSRAVHGTDRAFESDRQRDRILLAEGWRSTRITWRQLRDEPTAIAADLSRTLDHPNGAIQPGGHPSPSA